MPLAELFFGLVFVFFGDDVLPALRVVVSALQSDDPLDVKRDCLHPFINGVLGEGLPLRPPSPDALGASLRGLSTGGHPFKERPRFFAGVEVGAVPGPWDAEDLVEEVEVDLGVMVVGWRPIFLDEDARELFIGGF